MSWPLRAGCCQTPETSQHTSARLRIDQLQTTGEQVAGAVGAVGNHTGEWLAPLELVEERTSGPRPSALTTRASDKGFLPMGVEDYLNLLDWTGRQAVAGSPASVAREAARGRGLLRFRNPGVRLLDAASLHGRRPSKPR